jgi:hypothetical protein
MIRPQESLVPQHIIQYSLFAPDYYIIGFIARQCGFAG